MGIAIGTTVASPDQQVAVDDVILEEIREVVSAGSSSKPGLWSSSVFLAEWSVVQTSWHFTDDVSPIVDYQWALGESAVMSVSIQLSCLCRLSFHVCVDSAVMSLSIQLSCLCRYRCHVCVDTAVMSVSIRMSCLC